MRIAKACSRELVFTLILLAVAAAARGGVLWLRADELARDRDAYLQIAHNLAAGLGFSSGSPVHPTAYRPPLYPVVLAGIFAVGGSTVWLGLLQAAWGVATVGLTLRVGRALKLGSARFLATALVAIDPLLLQYTALPMTETLCAFVVMLWLAVDVAPQAEGERTPRRRFLSGAVFGLCCLCRPTFLAYLPLACAGWIATRWGRKPDRAPTAGRGPDLPGWFAAGLILVLAPWMVRNAIVLGKPTPATTHGGYTLLLANNPVFYQEVVARPWGTSWNGESLDEWVNEMEREISQANPPVVGEVSRDKWMNARAFRNIAEEPGWFVRASLWRVARLWDVQPHGAQAAGLPAALRRGMAGFYLLVLIGLAIGAWSLCRREYETWFPLLGLLLSVTLVHAVYWTDMRMRAPVVPVIAFVAARGWRSVIRGRCDRRSPSEKATD
jgi:hypothetical protein